MLTTKCTSLFGRKLDHAYIQIFCVFLTAENLFYPTEKGPNQLNLSLFGK